ncbi:phosphomannomutase/phosphoglucomutase [Patescibacteria group bacterium]|nr:phosphomannomutase/phosphoglucomutase [Patescibacteria group bacterium]
MNNMKIDVSIFKAYDIRGIFPSQLNADVVYKIGRAFVDYMQIKEVALGHDARSSWMELYSSLIRGINDAGAKVYDLGMIGTEELYFSVGYFGYESGLMLTASHNLSEYNGLKFVGKDAFSISENTGLENIKRLVIEKEYAPTNNSKNVEKISSHKFLKKAIFNIVDVSKIKPLKVVIDAGNGVGGILVNEIYSNTPLNIIPMYFEPDGRFPNHEANPTKEENTVALRKRVVLEKANIGIALDGDGDRCVFVDEKGELSSGYFLTAILAKKMLIKYPNAKIVHENRFKWAIVDAIKSSGGVGSECRAGYAFLKPKMREVGAVFGGETSSHFFYKDLFYSVSSMLTIGLILEELSSSGKKMSEILAPYREKYFISGEINFKVDNPNEILLEVKEKYKADGLEIEELDGVAVDNNRQWRFSLRKSNTEPLIRLCVEGKTKEIVSRIVKEVSAIIK